MMKLRNFPPAKRKTKKFRKQREQKSKKKRQRCVFVMSDRDGSFLTLALVALFAQAPEISKKEWHKKIDFN
jgi:hypothetical protein